ncbi:MAG: hypothetical protein LBO66_07780 [Deltaproteobacteria bacterium]|jgi:galactokinase/mevalonate kinase-like predicted kinase|nr:hypothetical protein [Deltaproteobacteria bacterium]
MTPPEVATEARELNNYDLMNELMEIKLSVRAMETILTERKAKVDENAKNIGLAFTDIKSLAKDVSHHEQRIKSLEDSFAKMEEIAQELKAAVKAMEKTLHHNSWLFTIGAAVVIAAVVKFFAG